MNINDFGDGFPTFPQFQQMLRDYERNWFKDRKPITALADAAQTAKKERQPAWVITRGGQVIVPLCFASKAAAQNYINRFRLVPGVEIVPE